MIIRMITVGLADFYSAFGRLILQFIDKKIRHGFHGSHDIRWQCLHSAALGFTGLNWNLRDLYIVK